MIVNETPHVQSIRVGMRREYIESFTSKSTLAALRAYVEAMAALPDDAPMWVRATRDGWDYRITMSVSEFLPAENESQP